MTTDLNARLDAARARWIADMAANGTHIVYNLRNPRWYGLARTGTFQPIEQDQRALLAMTPEDRAKLRSV